MFIVVLVVGFAIGLPAAAIGRIVSDKQTKEALQERKIAWAVLAAYLVVVFIIIGRNLLALRQL